MGKNKSVPVTASDTVSSYFKLITNLLHIGVTAATSTTVSLVSDAANRATERAVQPFNSLVRSATQQFFAPQISYPESRWDNLVGSVSGRRRAMTGSVSQATRNLERRGTISGHPQALARAPPKSTSYPAHLSLQDSHPSLSCRPQRPSLKPLDIPAASYGRASRHAGLRSPSPLSPYSPNTASPMSLPTPPLSSGTSCSSSSADSPSLRSPFASPPVHTPLSRALLSASMPDPSYLSSAQCKAAAGLKGEKRLYKGELARFSFWNLVGLAESATAEPELLGVKEERDFFALSGVEGHEIIVSCDDADEQEEQEDYRRFSYRYA